MSAEPKELGKYQRVFSFPTELKSDKLKLAEAFAVLSQNWREIAKVLDRPEWRRARTQVNAWALSFGFPQVYFDNGLPSIDAIEAIKAEVGLSGSSLEIAEILDYAFDFRSRTEIERKLSSSVERTRNAEKLSQEIPPLNKDHHLILEAMIECRVLKDSPKSGPWICNKAFGSEVDWSRKMKPLKLWEYVCSKPGVGTWITEKGIKAYSDIKRAQQVNKEVDY